LHKNDAAFSADKKNPGTRPGFNAAKMQAQLYLNSGMLFNESLVAPLNIA
jgi:hypothetical protein